MCNYIDNIVRGIANECHRQSDRSIPTIANFQKGLMKDKTTGMEKGNQLFVLYLALLPTMVRDKVVEIDSESRKRYTMKDDIKVYFDFWPPGVPESNSASKAVWVHRLKSFFSQNLKIRLFHKVSFLLITLSWIA